MEKIDSFTGTFGFLSNFFPALVYVPMFTAKEADDSKIRNNLAIQMRVPMPTLEHGYVVMKVGSWFGFVTQVRQLPRTRRGTEYPDFALTRHISFSPGQAKRLGARIKLRSDWEEIKLDVMMDLLRQKFAAPDLAQELVNTMGMELIEGNHWHDHVWGVCFCEKCNGKGENHLGRLLMELRLELKRRQQNV